MSNPPAFQFYAADFLIGVMGMSDADVGVYMKMLSYQWLHGDLPNCQKMIKKLINSDKKPSEIVMKKFEKVDEKTIRNLRLESVREKQKTFIESRKSNAMKRWEKDASASAVHKSSICKTHALQSSSSSSNILLSKDNNRKAKKSPFTPPSIDELRSFAKECEMPESDGEAMFYHWEGNGWRSGPNAVKSWRMSFRKWKANGWLPSQKQSPQKPATKPQSTFHDRNPHLAHLGYEGEIPEA